MELCEYNLEQYQYTRQHRPVMSDQAAILETWSIMMQIAAGVTYMHLLKEVHRDLKPRNSIYLLIRVADMFSFVFGKRQHVEARRFWIDF
jgi:hypothetical protein